MAKTCQIQDPSAPFPIQDALFGVPGIDRYSQSPFPPILRGKSEIIDKIRQETYRLGVDFEFNTRTVAGKTVYEPTIVGVGGKDWAAGHRYDRDIAEAIVEVAERGVKLVAHSGITADKPVLEQALDIKTPLSWWEDSMLLHYAANADFAKTADREEDEGDTGSMGLMNLWVMASLYLDVPVWKSCRGLSCEGPCPKHEPLSYCAIDAWAGVAAAYKLDEDLAKKYVPQRVYDHLATLSEICGKMQDNGVAIDSAVIAELNAANSTRKDDLFPHVVRGKKKIFTLADAGVKQQAALLAQSDLKLSPFNPNSPAQVEEYFAANGIRLKAADKKSVLAALRAECRRRGLEVEELENHEDATDIPKSLFWLYNLYAYKSSGKGVDAWVSPRYFRTDGFIHPRYIPTGTSMGRMSSSGPNWQNVPRLGFGKEFRKAVVPRDKSKILVESDFSQLEFRICLWYAGVTPPSGDIFLWLVSKAPEDFAYANKLVGNKDWTERDIAKSISHAADYGESFLTLSPADLRSERRISERLNGALVVYDGRDLPLWEYRGRIVCFTGVNIAERLFGDKSFENRKRALRIRDIYLSAVPQIETWHRAITKEIEEMGGVQSTTGRYLALYGSPEDDFKMGAAFKGQGGGADLVQDKMILHYEEIEEVPYIQVHDSICHELPREWSDDRCLEHMSYMTSESRLFSGLACPTKTKRGESWGTMTEIK